MLQFILTFLGGMLVCGILLLPLLFFMRREQDRRSRAARRRVRDAERLAELGTMTGGLAHEIKNPLSTLSLNAQLLAEEVADLNLPDDQRRRIVRRTESLRRESDRLKGILTDFLQFAGRIRLDPEPRDLNLLIDELVDFFLPQALAAGVQLRTALPGQVCVARVDSALFKQALLNLLLNAVQALEAMPADAGRSRELMIRLEPARASAPPRRRHGQSPEADIRAADPPASNPMHCIHVTDTGPGIAPEHLERIFQPYFSTKKGGTGLGLATARRIIEEHHGSLDVHAEPGRGTDFIILLPAADFAAAAPAS